MTEDVATRTSGIGTSPSKTLPGIVIEIDQY